ncbi:tetratricopeptide repeat-containing sensor histidine kinase [Hyunsoonleella ulvae]|uniref:tetratricopeptide repeat-containing sensor histidine kinase n=1 Tax=Hyunsoonleella ulvae TaxID=2799948 RepID=UPI00193A4010|nr:sensor histidine kinase [Hyunsoonleella ulvae]
MKNCVLYITLIVIAGSSYSQNENFYDSIAKVIVEQKSDSLKASKYYDAAAYSAQKLSDLKLMRLYTDSSMYYALRSGHKDLEAKNHFAYGVLERLAGNYSKALSHLHKNINYFENDSLMKPYAMFQVGVIHRNLGDLEKSLSTYLEILSIFQTRKDTFAIASTLNSIAVLYGEMESYDKAISNFKNAKALFIAKNVERDIANTDSNISEMYSKKGDYKSALEYANSALEVAKKIQHKNLIGKSLHSLGSIHALFDVDKGIKYLLDAREILFESNYSREYININREIGYLYFKNNQYSKAKSYLNEALELAIESEVLSEIKIVTKILADIYSKESNFKKAYAYRLQYETARDSIFNKESEESLNALQVKFETAKKDKEIAEQQLNIEQQELEIQRKNFQQKIMIVLVIALLLTSILIWFLYQQRQKRKDQEIISLKREKQVKTLELLMEGEEKERLRIAQELHDGVNVDLSAIKYKLTSLLEKNNQVINEAVSMIDKSCKQVRAISHNLVPPALKNFSLVEAIEDYCSTSNAIHNIHIRFQHLGNAIALSKKAEANVFRIVQELVNNSIKHAEATEIDVQISHQDDSIQLTIEDNGKGFNINQEGNHGIGLQNVYSRIKYLNAKLDVTSDNKGTSYVIDIDAKEII